MEWQGGHKDPAQLMSVSDTMASSLPHLPEGDLNQPLTLACGNSGGHPVALPLPQWVHCPQTSYDCIKNFGYVLTSPYKDVLEGIDSPLSDIHSPIGISEIQKEILYCNSAKATGLRPPYFSHDMDARKARFLRPHNEGEPANKITSTEYQSCGQTHNSWMAKPNKDNYGDSLPGSRAKVSASRYLSKNKSSPRRRATENDRLRKLRIEERLEALHKLIPHAKESDRASLLDDIIDHIKLLQLHIKELSRSRLGGQSMSDPLVFLEGYGHFLLHEHMVNEPLEEMMGKLLEVDPVAATQLLESRGLSMMPMSLADWLPQAV